MQTRCTDVRGNSHPLIYLRISAMNTDRYGPSPRLLGPALLALALLVSASAHAQGLYLPSGTGGVGVSGAFSGSEAGIGPALSLGYATEQRLGLGLTAAYLALDGDAPFESLYLVAPQVSFFGVRQTDGHAVNVQTSLGYERQTGNDNWDGADVALHSVSLGLVVSRDVSANPTYHVLPQLGVSFTGIYFGEDTPDEPVLTAGFGLGIGFPLGGGSVLAVEPGVAYNRAGIAGSVALGVVIPTRAK